MYPRWSTKDSDPICQEGLNHSGGRLVFKEDSNSVACECVNDVQDVRSRFICKLSVVLDIHGHKLVEIGCPRDSSFGKGASFCIAVGVAVCIALHCNAHCNC